MSGQGGKPSLLFVSPVVPSLSGNGVAMRCGITLEALAGAYRVSLLVVPLYPPFGQPVSLYFQQLCERSACVQPDEAPAAYPTAQFDAVHIFWLSALPFARSYFGESRGRFRSLDLCDVESRAQRSIAALHRANGDARQGDLASAEAKRYELLEGLACRMVDRVSVCSANERQLLLKRCPAEIVVWPNAVRVPANVAPRRPGVFRFLFVGTLGYFPNQDAIHWCCSSILPLIAQIAPIPFAVDIAGGGAPESLVAVASASGAHLLGQIPDLKPAYDAAHAVIVPLRAGGGTRIKILEAFSYGRPVVATPIGIEGIEASPGEHALVAESPEAFASACIHLMTDWELGERLASNASSLWRRLYSSEALQKAVASPEDSPIRPESPSGGAPRAPR